MELEAAMNEALDEARRGARGGEVPIGAVVLYNGEIISRAHNEVEKLQDACAHAEVLALRRASRHLSSWRLDKTSLFATLEPCPMCIGAMLNARVQKLYFACADPRLGAVGSLFDLSSHPLLPHKIEVTSGICEEESRALLQEFFRDCRKGK